MPTTVVNIRGRVAECLADPLASYVGRSGLYSLTEADRTAAAAMPALPPWAAMAWPRIRLTGCGLGNPWRCPRDGTLAEVLDRYAAWLLADPARVARARGLVGRRLLCWCCDDDGTGTAPLRCHAQQIAAVADGRLAAPPRVEPVGLFDGRA